MVLVVWEVTEVTKLVILENTIEVAELCVVELEELDVIAFEVERIEVKPETALVLMNVEVGFNVSLRLVRVVKEVLLV